MTTVAVKIWDMWSKEGYVPSDGSCSVYLVPSELAAIATSSESKLSEIAKSGIKVRQDDIVNAHPVEWVKGVLTYEGVEGIVEVPDGMTAVQVVCENICTDDDVYRSASILT